MLESAETPIAASKEMKNLYSQLVGQLSGYKGQKVYGYLPKSIKQTVDAIVAELAKDERIAELYAEWNKANREKLSIYYGKPKPDIPLEDNKEFRDIKNAVLRSAVLMMQTSVSLQSAPINSAVGNLIAILAKAIAASCQKRRMKLDTQIDSKLKSRIERKKQAHGLKTDRSVQAGHNEDEEQGMHLSM